MKALSIRQPWAWLIVHGYKGVENRMWPLPRTFTLPQRIYVHAGLKHDERYIMTQRATIVRQTLSKQAFHDYMYAFKASGAIVGEVTITGCVTESRSPWFIGPYGFTLTDPVAYETPIPCKGRQRFWTPKDIGVKP